MKYQGYYKDWRLKNLEARRKYHKDYMREWRKFKKSKESINLGNPTKDPTWGVAGTVR